MVKNAFVFSSNVQMMAVILCWEDARLVDVAEDATARAAVSNQRIPLSINIIAIPIIELLLLEFSGRLRKQDRRLLIILIILPIGSQKSAIGSIGN
jgi:hypothetical protein